MECTGERYLPEFDGDWTLEHVHRYLLACNLIEGKTVLDIACGDGYGSSMMANYADYVIGVDIDLHTIERAKRKYHKNNLCFIQGNATKIPLNNASVDIVVSFETIEHVVEQDSMMHEIKRVLRKDGILIISSPNKYEYSDITGYHNKFHPKELYFEEFKKLIQKNFINYKFLGQRVVFGSVIASTENSIFMSWIKGKSLNPTKGLNNILYYIALASDITIPKYPTSLYQASLEDSDFARYMNNNLSETNKVISDLLNSKSWKLTAPLRKFKSFIKKWNLFKG